MASLSLGFNNALWKSQCAAGLLGNHMLRTKLTQALSKALQSFLQEEKLTKLLLPRHPCFGKPEQSLEL